MGVFGEKHTSLTREQKRQLIHQADTHKLRPTEVCDWVLATWGLRIARVTVYSILHKQRASLMAGHKDLYQSMQNSVQALQQQSSSTSTNTCLTTEDACLERDPTTGRINKYQANTAAAGKRTQSTSSSARSASVMTDFSSMPPVPSGEGARWEGQLKRVREPASVELDRAMVQFLKSSAAVDEHGRRLNDAELQSHALRLARTIPSASRMRCSFGWLRHFKRRLGVQWAADRLGRHRWIVEMDPFGSSNSNSSETALLPSSSLMSTSSLSASSAVITQTSADVTLSLGPSSAPNRSRRQGKVAKHEHGNNNQSSSSSHSQSHATPDQITVNSSSGNSSNDDDDDDEEEYHSSHELLGKEHDFTSPIPSSNAHNNNVLNNPFLTSASASAKHTRSTSTSTSASTASTSASYSNGSNLRHAQTHPSLDMHQQHQQQQHRLYSFSNESSPFSALGHFPSLASHNTLLNSYPSPLHSTPTPTSSHPSHTSSILDSFPNLFDSLPPLHNTSSSIPTVSSSHLFLNRTSASLNTDSSNKTTTTHLDANNPFGMSVDGGMRKVPSKDEAYDMLQSLLLYYEQDHHYIGEQQTLLLPRWIHQQRQIMSQSDESDPRLLWMRNTAAAAAAATASSTPSLSSSTSSPAPHPLSAQSLSHPHSNFPQHHHNTHYNSNNSIYHFSSQPQQQQQQQHPRALSQSSSPPPSPLSTASTNDPAGLDHFQLNSSTTDSTSIPSTCATTATSSTPTTASVGTSSFPSLTSSLEQQMFFAHQHALQQQFALHQQHQQQQQQQRQQQQQQQQAFMLSHQ
ncbi:hypothetical protein BGX24_011761 [Mortierella sp. AD032]|nr:hypothetical protein BGX24_011761 [Mortierella sp. AD032]